MSVFDAKTFLDAETHESDATVVTLLALFHETPTAQAEARERGRERLRTGWTVAEPRSIGRRTGRAAAISGNRASVF